MADSTSSSWSEGLLGLGPALTGAVLWVDTVAGAGDKGHQYPGWEPVLCSPVRFTLTQSRALGETQDKHLYNVTCDDMAG